MAGCSVNKSAGLGATIVFFIGASIALETRSVNAARGGRILQAAPADSADYTSRLEMEFPAVLRHCLQRSTWGLLVMLNMKFHVSSALTYFGILVSVDCYRFRRSVILFERCYEFIIEKTTAE